MTASADAGTAWRPRCHQAFRGQPSAVAQSDREEALDISTPDATIGAESPGQEVFMWVRNRVQQWLERAPRGYLTTAFAAAVIVGMVAVEHGPAAQGGIEQEPPQTSKRVEQHRIHVDGGAGAPATLDALWEMSDSVLECVVVAEQSADALVPTAEGTQGVIVKTRHDCEVVSVFKSPRAAPGSLVAIERMGGRRDRGDHFADYTDEAFPPFEQGQHLLLFLRYVSTADMYLPVTGTADSAFLERNGKVIALGRSTLARSIAGQTLAEFAAKLRRGKGGRSGT